MEKTMEKEGVDRNVSREHLFCHVAYRSGCLRRFASPNKGFA
jgi:hypothetical protein